MKKDRTREVVATRAQKAHDGPREGMGGSRSLARRMKLASKAERGAPMDINRWLERPDASASRIEVYTAIRQYHYELHRAKLRRSIPYALWLVLSFPVRLFLRWRARRRAERAAAEQLPEVQRAEQQEAEADE